MRKEHAKQRLRRIEAKKRGRGRGRQAMVLGQVGADALAGRLHEEEDSEEDIMEEGDAEIIAETFGEADAAAGVVTTAGWDDTVRPSPLDAVRDGRVRSTARLRAQALSVRAA